MATVSEGLDLIEGMTDQQAISTLNSPAAMFHPAAQAVRQIVETKFDGNTEAAVGFLRENADAIRGNPEIANMDLTVLARNPDLLDTLETTMPEQPSEEQTADTGTTVTTTEVDTDAPDEAMVGAGLSTDNEGGWDPSNPMASLSGMFDNFSFGDIDFGNMDFMGMIQGLMDNVMGMIGPMLENIMGGFGEFIGGDAQLANDAAEATGAEVDNVPETTPTPEQTPELTADNTTPDPNQNPNLNGPSPDQGIMV